MSKLLKPLAAEFVGTFALIFVGAGAATALSPHQIVGVALAHGFTIMAFAFAYGRISGCHINPAVTLGLAASGRFPAANVVPYIVAQLIGGIAAGFALLVVFGGPVHHLGATLINFNLTTVSGAFLLEAIGTFFLVSVVLMTAVDENGTRLAPLAIGMTVAVCIMFFGPLTGASVNPARTIGPAIASGSYANIDVYILAQVVGGVVAGLLYRLFWSSSAAAAGNEVRHDATAQA